jgi:hypothetical protein
MSKVTPLKKTQGQHFHQGENTRDAIKEEPCLSCGRPTLGWGMTRMGRLCSMECQIKYKEGRFSEDGSQ